MPRQIEHKDLFYQKPAPTYRSTRPQQKRRRRRRSPLVPLFLLLLAVIAGFFLFSREGDETAPESSENSENPLVSDDIEFEVIEGDSEPSDLEVDEAPEIDTDYDNLTPAEERDISDASYELYNTMMIVDNIGYRYYTFSESNSITFINLVQSAGTSFGSDVNFNVMILPDATDIMLPQSFLADVPNTSDQQKALDYLNASINAVAPAVGTINVYDILKANCDKDIFFSTDRHWTALGAYYGYRMYANSVGLDPVDLTAFESNSYDGFCGSLYAQSNYNEALNYTEPLVTYSPTDSITASYSQSGVMVETELIADPTNYGTDQKYAAFLSGDYAYMEIVNNDLSDGSSLIVVKDSMGNAMVPYLACNYEIIYVVDYRTYSQTVAELVSSTGVKHVLFMCRLSATSESYDISLMENVF